MTLLPAASLPPCESPNEYVRMTYTNCSTACGVLSNIASIDRMYLKDVVDSIASDASV